MARVRVACLVAPGLLWAVQAEHPCITAHFAASLAPGRLLSWGTCLLLWPQVCYLLRQSLDMRNKWLFRTQVGWPTAVHSCSAPKLAGQQLHLAATASRQGRAEGQLRECQLSSCMNDSSAAACAGTVAFLSLPTCLFFHCANAALARAAGAPSRGGDGVGCAGRAVCLGAAGKQGTLSRD